MEPSCLLGLRNSHLLFESCAEGLEIRFEEPDVAAHHAEMGNLLSLYPKIHGLDADAEIGCRIADGKGKLFRREGNSERTLGERMGLGEVFSHALLYGII